MVEQNNIYVNSDRKDKYMSFISTLTKWVIWGGIIGIFTGTTTAFLKNIIKLLTDHREANPFYLFFLPLGGLFIGYIYKHYGKDTTKGNNLIIENIHNETGAVPLKMGPQVYLATFITHIVGGSTGREAAAVQMGASISEAVSRLFKVNKVDRKLLLMCGISGGFGSAFSAPLTGTIFGMEVVSLGKMKYEALVPCFVASFAGHFVAKAWGVPQEQFIIQSVPDTTAIVIVKIIILSIIFGLISAVYSHLRHFIENISKKYLKDPMIIGFVGGATILALVYIIGSNDYTGRGLKMAKQAFEGHIPPLAFLAKLVFTAITMGTGFRGGEAVPLFFIGSTLGNTLSGIVTLPTSFLAAIGLIAVFCGASNAPISCFMLSLEMFEGKGITFFFIACIISYIFSGHHGIYPAQKIFQPKSRLFNIANGETIESIEKKKIPPNY
jgi:H+/Cl- antiporter ClcA